MAIYAHNSQAFLHMPDHYTKGSLYRSIIQTPVSRRVRSNLLISR
jgi:hypothetical protein